MICNWCHFFLDLFDSKISVTVNLYCRLVSIKTEEVSLCLQLILKIVRTSQFAINFFDSKDFERYMGVLFP